MPFWNNRFQVLTKFEFYYWRMFLSFSFSIFRKNIIICGDDHKILNFEYFTSKKKHFFHQVCTNMWITGFSVITFFSVNSRIFNFWFGNLRIVSEDAFDLVDIDRYLQSHLTTLRNCKFAKIDLGEKRPFFPPRSDPKSLFDRKSLSWVEILLKRFYLFISSFIYIDFLSGSLCSVKGKVRYYNIFFPPNIS